MRAAAQSPTSSQQQLGHAALATTQLYAVSLSERRRDAVMALDFGAKKRAAKGRAKRGA